MKWKSGAMMICLALMLAGCGQATTDSLRVARVSETIGTVSVYRKDAGDGIGAVHGMNLASKDGLGTGLASGALLEVDSDKTVQVDENERMTVEKLVGDAITNRTVLNIEKGSAFFRLKKRLAPGSSFEVKTPTCIMGVRGTQFFVTVTDSATEIGVFEGHVSVVPGTVVAEDYFLVPATPSAIAMPSSSAAPGEIQLDANEWIRIPAGSTSTAKVVKETLALAHIPAYVLEAVKKDSWSIGSQWSGVPSPTAGAGSNQESADVPVPEKEVFDQIQLGMTLVEAEKLLGKEGVDSKSVAGGKSVNWPRLRVYLVADATGKLTSISGEGFPNAMTTTSLTSKDWANQTADLTGKPLSAAEAILGQTHQITGHMIEPQSGKIQTIVEWQVGESAWFHVKLLDGLINGTGSNQFN